MIITIGAVLIGRIAALGTNGAVSAIAKSPVTGSLAIHSEGLAGDEQADRQHHGGPEKAVHHYPFDHYATWRSELPDRACVLSRVGVFGENISTSGLTEADVCVGDVWRAGTALLQVSQARQPCWKLNERFGQKDMARRVQSTGRTGWYYRVIEPGKVEAGDTFSLIDRPCPAWPLARLLHVFYVDRLDRASLADIAELGPLSESWRRLATNRLARSSVEDWTQRLRE